MKYIQPNSYFDIQDYTHSQMKRMKSKKKKPTYQTHTHTHTPDEMNRVDCVCDS